MSSDFANYKKQEEAQNLLSNTLRTVILFSSSFPLLSQPSSNLLWEVIIFFNINWFIGDGAALKDTQLLP